MHIKLEYRAKPLYDLTNPNETKLPVVTAE